MSTTADRLFEYEYLQQLIRENPEASWRELAARVTEHERERRGDPGYPMVKPSTLASVWSRYRDQWADEGSVPVERDRYRRGGGRTQPWDNLPKQYWTDTYVRRVRMITRIAGGEERLPLVDVKTALNFARKLRDERKVVDLRPTGEPYERAARPDELDSTGAIIWITARYPGLARKTYEALDPQGRRAASLFWLPAGREPGPRVADLPLDEVSS